MNNIRLQIPAQADYLDVVRLCLYGIASKVGFTYEEIEDMKVAVAEACNNAVLHAYPDKNDGVIDIHFDCDATSIKVVVKDYGVTFNHTNALQEAAPIRGSEARELQAGGLGIYLMQALMDEVSVQSEQGTQVTLTKFRAE
jgi:serine/threonine-protein kinase RsbW